MMGFVDSDQHAGNTSVSCRSCLAKYDVSSKSAKYIQHNEGNEFNSS